MYSPADLTAEIQEQFKAMESESGRVPKAWLIRSVMAAHPDVEGDDTEFYVHGAERHVTSEVESYFRQIKARETDLEEQFVLEGFKHIKRRYLVEREGDVEAVHVRAMTPNELEAKAEELERFARGAFAHASELRRLADSRAEAA